ncbi:hypothetical protein ACOSQ3_032563 [Xanthoceras sorbifolium]
MSTSENDQPSTSNQPNRVRFETIEADIRDVRTEMTRLSTTVGHMLARLKILHPARGADLGVEEEVIQGDRRTHGERPPQANPLYESDDRYDQRDRPPAHYRHGGRVERGDRVVERWIEPNQRRQRPGVGRRLERDGSSSEKSEGTTGGTTEETQTRRDPEIDNLKIMTMRPAGEGTKGQGNQRSNFHTLVEGTHTSG